MGTHGNFCFLFFDTRGAQIDCSPVASSVPGLVSDEVFDRRFNMMPWLQQKVLIRMKPVMMDVSTIEHTRGVLQRFHRL